MSITHPLSGDNSILDNRGISVQGDVSDTLISEICSVEQRDYALQKRLWRPLSSAEIRTAYWEL